MLDKDFTKKLHIFGLGFTVGQLEDLEEVISGKRNVVDLALKHPHLILCLCAFAVWLEGRLREQVNAN